MRRSALQPPGSELYQLLEGIEGLDHASIDELTSSPPADSPPWCVEARELRHEQGGLIALELADHHLPWVAVTVEDGSDGVEERHG